MTAHGPKVWLAGGGHQSKRRQLRREPGGHGELDGGATTTRRAERSPMSARLHLARLRNVAIERPEVAVQGAVADVGDQVADPRANHTDIVVEREATPSRRDRWRGTAGLQVELAGRAHGT